MTIPRVLFLNDPVLRYLVLQTVFLLSNDAPLLCVKASLFPEYLTVFQQHFPSRQNKLIYVSSRKVVRNLKALKRSFSSVK